jgi:16S rRNA U516 pseudouridylate synthase RsuA-like enzyme
MVHLHPQVMAAAGVASRRACEELIFKGLVKVNGNVVNSQVQRAPQHCIHVSLDVVSSSGAGFHHLQVLIDPAVDKIEVQGKALNLTGVKEKLFYFVLNKPKVGAVRTRAANDILCWYTHIGDLDCRVTYAAMLCQGTQRKASV